MTRTVSSQVDTEIARDVTLPGYLVEILFPDPVAPFRVSTRGDVVWDGKVFIAFGFSLRGLGIDASRSSIDGEIVFQDTDNAVGTLLLSFGMGDREINVWKFYGDASLGATDPIHMGRLRGGNCSINPSAGTVTVGLLMENVSTLYCPRTYLTKETGFNFLAAPGTVIEWGRERYVLNADER